MNEAMHHASKNLFAAAEAIREALDTIELNKIEMDGATIEALGVTERYLTANAQRMQRASKN